MSTNTDTSPIVNDTVYGPEGMYVVIFKGERNDDGIGVISASGPKRLTDEMMQVAVRITEGYTVANLETFSKIIKMSGYTVTEFLYVVDSNDKMHQVVA